MRYRCSNIENADDPVKVYTLSSAEKAAEQYARVELYYEEHGTSDGGDEIYRVLVEEVDAAHLTGERWEYAVLVNVALVATATGKNNFVAH